MKSKYLFATKFKKVGGVFLIIGLVMGVLYLGGINEPPFFEMSVFSFVETGIMDEDIYFGVTQNNIFDELILLFLLIGLLLIGFSKQRVEDEYISKIRLDCLLWATYLNYIILILAIIFTFGFAFFWVLVFNVFTILVFYNIRFHYIMYKNKRLI